MMLTIQFKSIKNILYSTSMASYSKSFEDYFRIPILIKPITNITPTTQSKLEHTLYYKYHTLTIDQRYTRIQQNINTDILAQREQCVQKLYFTPEEISSDWPEFEVIYKIRYAIGIIDQAVDEKIISDILSRLKLQNTFKLIGIINMGNETYQNLIVKQNIIKYPELVEEEFKHFIEPWLYNCLAFIESDICNIIAQAKREDDSNRTVVFNRMEDKFDPKVIKKKKKYRCMKLCGDYHLMLHLYKEAYAFFNEAEDQLRKLDDYMWVLGVIQGKLACTAVCQSLNLSNNQEYIDHLIAESYTIAKKAKISQFQGQNYMKIIRLYVSQPEKMEDLLRSFISSFGKSLHQDDQFLLYTVLGELYEKCGLVRKKNYYYFLASMIHLNKKSQLSEVLLLQIQKEKEIKESPFLYKEILKRIISCSQNAHQNSKYFLQLLSKCGNHLTDKEIQDTLAELNFNHHPILHLDQIDFIRLKEFQIVESKVKPKQNRIGKRKEGVIKTGPGFFMSWKKQQHLLFEENEEIIFTGAIYNTILFPIRLKISFEAHLTEDPGKVLAKPELFCYIQPNNLHKFQSKVRLKGATQKIWMIDRVELSVWNFKTNVSLQKPIKFQIYEKQPQIALTIEDQIKFQQSSDLYIEASLKATAITIPFCLIRLSISVYYTVDVGFQENEIFLSQQDDFKGIDFDKFKNLRIIESRSRQEVHVSSEDGCLWIEIKKLKVHRRHVGRVEFSLQYIRDLNTKYQTSKHYVSKCTFYQDFKCQIEQISTPTIEKIYKNPLHHSKIIQKHFTTKLKMTKLNNSKNPSSYKIFHEGNQYLFRQDNTATITFVRPKIQKEIKNDDPVLNEVVLWQNVFNPKEKGQIQMKIPFHPLMKQCQREVVMNISTTSNHDQHCKKKISYSIYSQQPQRLSHQITLNPLEAEIDRQWIMIGKNKVEADHSTKVENVMTIVFSKKCKSSYQLGIVFKDGWNYWHGELIELH